MPEFLIFILTLPVVLFYIAMLAGWRKVNRSQVTDPEKLPFLSVLISIRNEEPNIFRLCQSLDQLDYPKDRFEILIGDDHSTDESVEILKRHAPKNAQLFEFLDESDAGKKAVLSRLIEKARGEYYVFTDGDMIFNRHWLRGLLYNKKGELPHLQLGVTQVADDRWFGEMQNLDWLTNQAVLAWFANNNNPLTAWGNNLIIDKKSYESAGGFNKISDTVTEDVDLLLQLKKTRGTASVKFDASTLATTQPESTLLGLLYQRKRWLQGAHTIPVLLKIGFLLKWLFIPLVIVGTIGQPIFSVWLVFYFILSFLFTQMIYHQIGQQVQVSSFLSFLMYEFAVYFLTFVFYLMPIKLKWKNRYY